MKVSNEMIHIHWRHTPYVVSATVEEKYNIPAETHKKVISNVFKLSVLKRIQFVPKCKYFSPLLISSYVFP